MLLIVQYVGSSEQINDMTAVCVRSVSFNFMP